MITVTVRQRGCGWPKEGGFYVLGAGRAMTCFALPVELKPCPCCNQQPKFARCPTSITPEYLHLMFFDCEKNNDHCNCCIRDDRNYWISWIGGDYTADEFNNEIRSQGLSRKIPPSFAKVIKSGDYFVNVKNGEIISMTPITSVRYYVKYKDDPEKIKTLEDAGIECAKIEREESVQLAIK